MEMPVRRSILLASELVLAFCVAQTAAAQVPTLSKGTRVRLSAADLGSQRLIGVVDSVSADMFTMRLRPGVSASIPFGQVTRLEVVRGEKRPTWSKTAPLWLTASAAGLGAILSDATYEPDGVFTREGTNAIAAVGFGALGLLVGTGIAISVKEEQWETVLDRTSSARTASAQWF
jgi:hypothetical protein